MKVTITELRSIIREAVTSHIFEVPLIGTFMKARQRAKGKKSSSFGSSFSGPASRQCF